MTSNLPAAARRSTELDRAEVLGLAQAEVSRPPLAHARPPRSTREPGRSAWEPGRSAWDRFSYESLVVDR